MPLKVSESDKAEKESVEERMNVELEAPWARVTGTKEDDTLHQWNYKIIFRFLSLAESMQMKTYRRPHGAI